MLQKLTEFPLLPNTKGFRSTFDIYSDLRKVDQDDQYTPILKSMMNTNGGVDVTSEERHINVCIGKEWYRYPSSFFLPDSRRYRMRFIRSEFRGQLPKLYEEDDEPDRKSGLKTRLIYDDFNDLNKEEPSRYTRQDRCHYLIDTRQKDTSDREPNYSDNTKDWTVLSTHKMLDLANSPVIIRSFYVPIISERRNRYVMYQLLKNNNLFIRNTGKLK